MVNTFFSKIPGFYEIPQGHCAILQKYGAFEKVLYAGLHSTNPLTSSLKPLQDWKWTKKETFVTTKGSEEKQTFFCSGSEEWTCAKPGNLMELSQQQWMTDPCSCYTRDRVQMDVQAILRFKIKDPCKAAYGIDVLPSAIHSEAQTVLRLEIAKQDFGPYIGFNGAKFFDVQNQIGESVLKELQNRVEDWGVEVLRVDIGPVNYRKEDVISIYVGRFLRVLSVSALVGVAAFTGLGIADFLKNKA